MTIGTFLWKVVCLIFAMICFSGSFGWFADGNIVLGVFCALGGILWSMEAGRS